MRTLCLRLQHPQNLTIDASCAEIFLKFSPRIQFRYPDLIFADIESTAHLFGGDFKLLKTAVDLARTFAPGTTGAVADHPTTAQALVGFKPFEVSRPGEDQMTLGSLPLQALEELEGLKPWSQKRQIEHVVDFFQALGMSRLDEVLPFSLGSFRERWNEVGVQLWQRLHAKELQSISPLVPQDPFISYLYLENSLDNAALMLREMRSALQFLFCRLEGLGRFAEKLLITLHCEFSDKKLSISITPVSPSRDLQLFVDLLRNKLDGIDLENPVKEIEIEIFDAPEKTLQMNFFEPRDSTEDRWKRLISFAQQNECQIGFLQPIASHFPEQSYQWVTDWPKVLEVKDTVEKNENALQVKQAYAKNLSQSPRPSLILKNPRALNPQHLEGMKFLSKFPIERIESSWWEKLKEKFNGAQMDLAQVRLRDYYFALSSAGQLCWVFKDRESNRYYIHGFFD